MIGAPGNGLRVKTAAKSGVGSSSAISVSVILAGFGASVGVNAKRLVPTRNPRGRAAWLESQARWASRSVKVSWVLATRAELAEDAGGVKPILCEVGGSVAVLHRKPLRDGHNA